MSLAAQLATIQEPVHAWIGPLVPSAHVERALFAYERAITTGRYDIRLFVAGPAPDRAYRAALERFARERCLLGCRFVPDASDADLAALRARADLLTGPGLVGPGPAGEGLVGAP